MKLQEIFNQLRTAEFSQLNFGAGQGVLDTDDVQDKLVDHVNLGLTDLYGRFELKVGRLDLALLPGQTSYLLTSVRAVSKYKPTVPPADPAPEPYILDSVENPFRDDILTIERVYTENGYDFELALNRLDRSYSLMTTEHNRLEVPNSIVDQSLALPPQLLTSQLRVLYRANHPIIDTSKGGFDPERLEISLPRTHLTALLWFVASRANNPVGLGQEFNAGNTYAAKYEAECARLKNDGHEVQQRGNDSKFTERGFV